MKFWSKKNTLDEMQEQQLLHLEAQGFWLLWGGLLLAMMLQSGPAFDPRQMLGESVVFMAACAYMIIGCLFRGIWDRHLLPNAEAIPLEAGVAGVVVFLLNLCWHGMWLPALLSGLFTWGLTALILWGTLLLYKKTPPHPGARGERRQRLSKKAYFVFGFY